jgi:hypothetical protein
MGYHDTKNRLERCIAQKNREVLSIKWEKQYTEFEEHVGMPKKESELCNWKSTQLNNGPYGLDVRFDQEIAETEGGTVWSDRKVRLEKCIAQKKAA